MRRKTIKFKNGRVYLGLDRYRNNERLAIFIQNRNGTYLDDVTINLSDIQLPKNKLVAINANCKNSGLEQALIEAGIIKGISYMTPYNYQVYDVVEINIEKLKEYDPEGYAEYFKEEKYQKYNIEEMKKILKEEGYCYVDTSNGNSYIISKNDIADFIMQEVEKSGHSVDIAMYAPSKFEEPILTTRGMFLDRVNLKLRGDIIERLLELQMCEEEPKEIKIFDMDEFFELDRNKKEDKKQYNKFYKKYYEEEQELEA